MRTDHDVIIVGGGVTGTALLFMLAAYTDVPNIALLERRDKLAQVSSKATNNSQTLHFGDIETNYTREKAREVCAAARMVARYADALPEGAGVHRRIQKMVLAVGDDEIAALRRRHADIKGLFPTLRYVAGDELAAVEPAVTEGRDRRERVAALYEERGYVVDYERLSGSFAERAAARTSGPAPMVATGLAVRDIREAPGGYVVVTDRGDLRTRTVVVSAGAHSLWFARKMGCARGYAILPVAGDFYRAPNVLRGKVYRVQLPGLPFAAIHGDPDITDPGVMRFGPVPFAVPFLEPRTPASFAAFLRTFTPDLDTFMSMVRVNAEPIMRRFVAKSVLYRLPFLGRRAVHAEARAIVPALPLEGFDFGRDLGGIRPQLVRTKERRIHMGEAKFTRPGAIFNVTPSPGASVCLKNAEKDMRTLLKWLGGGRRADEVALAADLGGPK